MGTPTVSIYLGGDIGHNSENSVGKWEFIAKEQDGDHRMENY